MTVATKYQTLDTLLSRPYSPVIFACNGNRTLRNEGEFSLWVELCPHPLNYYLLEFILKQGVAPLCSRQSRSLRCQRAGIRKNN